MTLKLNNVSIHRPDGIALINNLNLEIHNGDIVTIMGPSGCGKSTLLAAINGSMANYFSLSGEIWLNHRELQLLPMEQRHIGILFQDDLLFPHMNVFENLAFGIPAEATKAEKINQITTALATAGLSGFENRKVTSLSGGQRARISLLRMLLSQPQAILLDEPFNKLDQQLRAQFREFVFTRIRERNIPALLVTHDEQDRPSEGAVMQLEQYHA